MAEKELVTTLEELNKKVTGTSEFLQAIAVMKRSLDENLVTNPKWDVVLTSTNVAKTQEALTNYIQNLQATSKEITDTISRFVVIPSTSTIATQIMEAGKDGGRIKDTTIEGVPIKELVLIKED